MASVTVHNGNFGSNLHIDYSFSTSGRSWSLSCSLVLHVPNGYYFGPWGNTNAHDANLRANGIGRLSSGDHTLATWGTSGGYDAAGNAPGVGVSWCLNANSSWAGMVNPSGSVTLWGPAIGGETYTISYAANGGNTTPGNQTKTYGVNLGLSGAISRNDSTSTGYTTTFNANGGTCSTTSLTATNVTKYAFSSWRDNQGDTYGAWGTYTKNQGNTMTAQWSSVTTNGSITLPTATRTYYTFNGWATSSTSTSGSTGEYTPTATRTLYATWAVNAPTDASIRVKRTTRTKINVVCDYTGAELTDYTVYYKPEGADDYLSKSFGTTETGYITNLDPNSLYQIYVKATNAGGSKDSALVTARTMANVPIVNRPVASNIMPFDTDITVSAVGDTNAPITNYTVYWALKPTKNLYDMSVRAMGDGSLWARIFYHQCDEGATLFTSLAECKNIQTAKKYSRLYLLDDDTYKGSDNKFEFMLTYPNDTMGYNRWKQTNAPQAEFVPEDSTGAGTVSGYEPIHIDWSSNYWGGIARQNSDVDSFDLCYLSGSVGHHGWYYALGASSTYYDGIPSSKDIKAEPAFSDCVELWVRIDDGEADSKSFGTATTSNVEGLSEETTYIFWTQATNIGGITTGPSLEVITPADQAKIRIKDGGEWVKGKAWYKKDGEWVKAKKVYIKINGQWVIGYNYEN